MKKIAIFLILLGSMNAFAQKSTVKEAFLEKWENSKNYLLAMAEAMPEEHFDFSPTERQMTFKAQLIHIKGNMDWLSKTYFTSEEFKRQEAELPETKEETIRLVEGAFDATSEIIKATPDNELEETVEFFSGPKSKLQILNLLQDHVTHHRGQIIVYLNLNKIEPPRYVGW